MEILRLENVIKIYGKGTVAAKAVDGISFSVNRSEFVTIMGASGSGKTTLLNLIASIDSVSGGRIVVDGMEITLMSDKYLAAYRREKLGFIFQEYNLLDTLTVHENIFLPLALKGTSKSVILEKTDEILKVFKLEQLKDKFPNQISGGERQRTACARALITNPALIMADEPTGALDSKNSKNLMQLLQLMNSSYGSTILTVTHDPVVASYAGRVLFLKDGKINNEIYKGEKSDDEFFRQIVEINSAAGGENYAG